MFGTLSTRKKAWVIAVLTCLALLSVDALATERPALPAKPPGSEQAPDSVAFYHFMLGYQRELNNDAGEAEQTIRRGIAVSQTAAPTGYLYLGHILVEQKAWDRAVQAYRDALAINPSFEPAHLGLAATLEAKGDTAQAIAVLRKVLQEVNKGNREARQRLVRLLLTQKAYEPALALLREAIQESPDDVDAQLRIGLIYGELKDYVKAVEQIKRVLVLGPQELGVRDHLAYLYEEMKEVDKAIAEYRTIIQADARYSDVHRHLGSLLVRLERNDEALPHFQQVIVLNPKMTEPYLLLGLTLLQASRQEEAVAVFREGLLRNPESADLHFNLGTAYDKMGRFDELGHEMKEAIRLDSPHPDSTNVRG